MYKKPNHEARQFLLPEISLHQPPHILPPPTYIPRLLRTLQKEWESRLVHVWHLVPHVIGPHVLEQKARPHDLERFRDRMQALVVPVHVSPDDTRPPRYSPLRHRLSPHVLERAAAALPRYCVHHSGGAVWHMHQDAIDGNINGDFIDVGLAHGLGEAGAEGDPDRGRGDDCSEPWRCGCGTPDLVIGVGVAEGGADDGRAHDQ